MPADLTWSFRDKFWFCLSI